MIITYALMAFIVLFLTFELLFKAEYIPNTAHLFDKQNSNAMRGFWCMIVILVHIPTVYQNRIQDILGSFAYIGVTFFFMTSAYGLRLGIKRNPENIKCFWRKRLPRLLIPMFFVNVVSLIFRLVQRKGFFLSTLININGWVQWLLVCYLIFWIVNRFATPILPDNQGEYQDIIVCVLIVTFSLTVYLLKSHISSTTWCPEIFGFVWGIIFFHIKKSFFDWVGNKWISCCAALCIIAGIAGIAYLKFKLVVFFGDYLLKIVLGMLIITFMLAVNSRIAIGNKMSLFLGSISYEIYLLHGSVFGLLATSFPGLSSGVFIVLSMLITVGLSYVVSIRSKPIVSRIDKVLIRQ